MGKNVIYTIWLQHCIGYCNSRVNSIVNLFESSERVYRAGETELRMSGLFTPGQINKLLNKDLYDMHIRVQNMKETKFRAFMLNVIFTINSFLPF